MVGRIYMYICQPSRQIQIKKIGLWDRLALLPKVYKIKKKKYLNCEGGWWDTYVAKKIK